LTGARKEGDSLRKLRHRRIEKRKKKKINTLGTEQRPRFRVQPVKVSEYPMKKTGMGRAPDYRKD